MNQHLQRKLHHTLHCKGVLESHAPTVHNLRNYTPVQTVHNLRNYTPVQMTQLNLRLRRKSQTDKSQQQISYDIRAQKHMLHKLGAQTSISPNDII